MKCQKWYYTLGLDSEEWTLDYTEDMIEEEISLCIFSQIYGLKK